MDGVAAAAAEWSGALAWVVTMARWDSGVVVRRWQGRVVATWDEAAAGMEVVMVVATVAGMEVVTADRIDTIQGPPA